MDLLLSNLDRLAAVDVETTGTNPFRHQILSLAIVPLDSDKPSLELYIRCSELVWQEKALQYFEGFQSIWAAEAISPRAACDRLETYLCDHFETPVTLVGHNVAFDIAFLKQLAYLAGLDELPCISHRVIDTHTILFVLHVYGLIPEEALSSTGAFAHYGVSPSMEQRHSAMADAIATRELFIQAMTKLSSHDISGGQPFLSSLRFPPFFWRAAKK